jgi:stress-induced-phosphoprotein 1
MNPSWGKGFQRKAMALHGLNELQKSYDTYEAGLKVDPNNAQIKSGMQNVMRDQ